MIGFAQIAGGAPSSVANMTEHLLTQTLEAEDQRLADYYNRGGERAVDGQEPDIAVLRPDLHPKAAEGLGIVPGQKLDREAINGLLSGRRADGGTIEGKHYAKVRNLGVDEKTGEKRISVPIGSYDFCPTPDKSLSVAWAFAAPAERAVLYNIHLEAARDAVAHIAERVGVARLGKGGESGTEPGHVAWVEFTHHTARRVSASVEDGEVRLTPDKQAHGDPDLHTHFLIPNAVFCESGKVGSLHTDMIRGFIFEADGLYHARLTRLLNDAGYRTELDERTGAARLTAIPEDVCRLFSKRTLLGEQAAKARAASQGEEWDALTQEQREVRTKVFVQNLDQKIKGGKDDVADFADWRRQAQEFGWEPPLSFRVKEGIAPELAQEERIRVAYEAALPLLEKRLEESAVLTHHEVRAIAARGLVATGTRDAADIDRITALMRKEGVRQYGEQTPLVWGLEEGRKFVSVTTALHESDEKEFLALATAAADKSAAVPKTTLDRAIEASGLDFTEEHGKAQLRAIRTLGEGGRLGITIGSAGAGKTALLKVLVPAWREEGREVVGASLAWRQADALVDGGIETRNLKAFSVFIDAAKAGELKLGPKSVVVVDEVGQLGTRQALELLRLRDRHGFSIVALGDDKQCASIQAGAIIDLTRRALGAEQVPEILTTVRQKTEREKEIAGLFRERQARKALDMKRSDGSAEMVPGGYEQLVSRAAGLYTDRLKATGEAPSVAAPTNADAHRIGEAIREERRRLGLLGTDVRTLKVRDTEGQEISLLIAKGEHLRLFKSTGAKYASGHGGAIGRNGTVVEVEGVDRTGMTLRNLKNGRVGHVTWDGLADKKTGEIRLSYGYAATIHTAQGSTAKEHILALPAGSQAINGLTAYSGNTRHEFRSWFLTSDHAEHVDVRKHRPLNDAHAIDANDKWANVAKHLSYQPEKDTVMAMLERVTGLRRGTVLGFAQSLQPAEARTLRGDAPAFVHEIGLQRRLSQAVGHAAEYVVELSHRVRVHAHELAVKIRDRERAPRRGHGLSL